MKKFFKLLLLTISILIVSVPVFANTYDTMLITSPYDPTIANGIVNDEILVQLNGEVVNFTQAEGKPQIINDRTVIPARKVFEGLGAKVDWVQETREVKITTEELEITLQIDNNIAKIKDANEEIKEVTLDTAPVIRDERTLIPARFVAESLGKKVGWDAYNRTVIIIDTKVAEETIKEKASNFYEYITTDFEKINTYEMNIDLEGKVKYEDKEYSKNDTSLNILGDMGVKLSEDMMKVDLDLDFSGKGLLIEEIKEEKLEDLAIDVIVDLENSAIYTKMSNLEDDKWVKYNFGHTGTELKTIMEMAKKQDAGMKALMDALLPEDRLTVLSYSELQASIELLTMLMGNDNFKVSGRTTKTYTYEFDLSKLLVMLADLSGEEATDENINIKLGLEVKVENKVAKQSKVELEITYSEDEENVEVSIEADGKVKSYNEEVKITLPDAEDVIELYAE